MNTVNHKGTCSCDSRLYLVHAGEIKFSPFIYLDYYYF